MGLDERSDKMPSGIPYIISNEIAERFSYYGMRAILTVFMTEYLMDNMGHKAPMGDEESKVWYHTFSMGVYFFPIIGAFIADAFWGKYKTILTLSVVYCLGHLALALDDTRTGLAIGLTLIAIGSGGIKPCVSANLGDQFSAKNNHLIEKVFNYFYMSVNFGALISTVLIPLVLEHFGASVAFGIPGILMFIATVIFWLGRNSYKKLPAVGWATYKKEVFTREGAKAIGGLLSIFGCCVFFWSLYEQNASAWVLQAKSPFMDKHVDLSMGIDALSFLKFELLPDQVQAANPLFVLILVPLFVLYVYPAISSFFPLTPLRKMSIGMFITVLCFLIVAWIEWHLSNSVTISIWWQVLAFFVLIVAEVMVYGTGLEFSYTQAPNAMKSVVMGLFLLSISLGNFVTAFINAMIADEHGNSIFTGVQYYLFFAAMMFAVAVLFIFVAMRYKEKRYIQE
ncbi:MAG TPA: POT family MFS transporter [Cytophagaceae bacterium]|jgi:POT family proton-dependent oligopeptide transporter|nr:POT family MFS transporter [Cytophagaceae bacterium]